MTQKFMKLPKATHILSVLNKHESMNITQIQLETKITYAHITNTIKYFGEEKFVICQRSGRTNNVMLTTKGRRLNEYFNKIKELIRE